MLCMHYCTACACLPATSCACLPAGLPAGVGWHPGRLGLACATALCQWRSSPCWWDGRAGELDDTVRQEMAQLEGELLRALQVVDAAINKEQVGVAGV